MHIRLIRAATHEDSRVGSDVAQRHDGDAGGAFLVVGVLRTGGTGRSLGVDWQLVDARELDSFGRVLDDDPAVGTGEEQDVELAFSGKIVGEQPVEIDSGDHSPTSPVRDVELLVSRVELQLRYRRIARGAQQLPIDVRTARRLLSCCETADLYVVGIIPHKSAEGLLVVAGRPQRKIDVSLDPVDSGFDLRAHRSQHAEVGLVQIRLHGGNPDEIEPQDYPDRGCDDRGGKCQCAPLDSAELHNASSAAFAPRAICVAGEPLLWSVNGNNAPLPINVGRLLTELP